MLEVTDYMLDYVNKEILLDGDLTKEEIKVFETFSELAMFMYDGNFELLASDLEEEFVADENISLLDNLFYDTTNVFQDSSYGYIYYLEL